MNDAPSLIINPATGDASRAEDILNDVREVLKKHGCCLILSTAIGQPNEMVLAKMIDGDATKARAIAGVRQILPTAVTFRTIDWTPKMGKLQ